MKIVSLFDVDNTLLNNDHVTLDLKRRLEHDFGPKVRDRYFAIFEELRGEKACQAEGSSYPEDEADQGRAHSLHNHEREEVSTLGAEGHADS